MIAIIETDHLILRELLPSDDEGMFLLDHNPNVHRYLGNNPVDTIDESRNYIAIIRKQYIENGIGRFAVVLKETNEFIGWAGIKLVTEEENNHIDFYDLGYRLREEFWGKGYGYEVAKAWRDYAFNEMNIQTINASADINNAGSRRILEKIGMLQINEYYWEDIRCAWYELDKTDYLK